MSPGTPRHEATKGHIKQITAVRLKRRTDRGVILERGCIIDHSYAGVGTPETELLCTWQNKNLAVRITNATFWRMASPLCCSQVVVHQVTWQSSQFYIPFNHDLVMLYFSVIFCIRQCFVMVTIYTAPHTSNNTRKHKNRPRRKYKQYPTHPHTKNNNV
jgi:hypothetical protein